MAYTADRLYNEVIRKEMAVLSSKVKVRDIVGYLPCLTITDREEIEAKRESAGNYCAMMVLLDNLRRRENWPGQFITALQQIEQTALANLISDAYNNIRGIHTAPVPAPAPAPASAPASAHVPAASVPIPAPSPAEPSATFTTATIHKIPCSTPPLLTPSVQTPAQTSTSSPINSASRPHSNKTASDSADGHAEVSAPDAPVHTPPRSAHPTKPVLSVIAPDARPPFPVSAPTLTPSAGQSEVSVDARETPTPGISNGLTNVALSGPSSHGPTVPSNPTSYEVNKPDTTSQSSVLPEKVLAATSTSVQHPVQDTNPPETVLARDSQNNPTNSQVGEGVHTSFLTNCRSQGTAQASPSASSGAAAGCSLNFATENEENFSKPGVLQEEEPVSFSSDPSLQFSNMTAESSPSQPARPQAVPNRGEEPVNEHVSVTNSLSSSSTTVPSLYVSDHVGPVQNSIPRAFENGFPEGGNGSYPHQPVEDHYDSLQTRGHVVQFSENPSLQNLSGQPLSMVRQTTIDNSQQISVGIQRNNASEQAGSAASFTTYAGPPQSTFHQSELNASNQVNLPRSELRVESQGVLHQFQSNSHLIAAAAFGMAAVFVALKFKH